MSKRRQNGKSKSVTLNQDIYDKLELFKASLIGFKKDPNLTYNDVVIFLLDLAKEKGML